MHRFSPAVLSKLSASGWTPKRQVDVRLQLDAISSAGFSITECSKNLISQFQGIRMNAGERRFCFDVFAALRQIEAEEVPYIKTLLSDCVCPIGYEEAGSTILFSSAPDKLFGLNDEWLGCWSFDSVEAMFECLIFAKGCHDVKIDNSKIPPSMRD